MNPNRLIAAGALIAGTLIGHAFSTSSASAFDCSTVPPEAPPVAICQPKPTTTTSSIPAPPVESTTATSTTLPPVVEVAPPHETNDPVSDPRVSGWVVKAPQIGDAIAITAPTTVEPNRGCGA